MPFHCWQLKFSKGFYEDPGTSARYSIFTKRVEAVTPPVTNNIQLSRSGSPVYSREVPRQVGFEQDLNLVERSDLEQLRT